MKSWWYILLIIPYIATLWVPFYASKDPVLFGIPYFYWYQFLWVVISAVLTGIVYVATKKSKKGAFLLEGFSGT
jgi:hypothetical protein